MVAEGRVVIRLRRIDHVGLRVADLDEASARWALQLGLVERVARRRARVPRLQRRAVLPRARRGRRARARPRRVRAASARARSTTRARTSRRRASSTRSATARSASPTPTAARSSCCRTVRRRRRPRAGPSTPAPRRPSTSAGRGGSATSTASRARCRRTRRSTWTCSGWRSRTGSATPGVWFHIDADHHVMALVDLGLRALPPPRLRRRRHREDARPARPPRPARALGRRGGRRGTGSPATSPRYVRIVEEPCFVELYCDMEQLADDHVPRVYPDDRYSSNTWGPLPPRSYFRFDPVAVEFERESWETRGRLLPPRRRRDEPQGLHGAAHARGALLARAVPAVALRRRLPRDRLLGRSREGGRVPAGGHRAASRSRPLRLRRGRLAVVLRARRRARRPLALAVQGGLRRRQRAARRRGGHRLPVHLGRPRLRAHARVDPGLPEEARLDLDHPQLRARRPGRPRDGAGRALRRDLRGVRAPSRRGDRHARASVRRRAVPQRARRSSTCATSRASPPGATTSRPCTSSCAPSPATGPVSEVWEGTATLALFGAGHEEVDALAPVRLGRGYRFTFAYTVDDLETVRELGA